MNYKSIIIAVIACLMFTSCGIYKKYESSTEVSSNALGSDVTSDGSSSEAGMSWKEFFTDPILQQLIDSVLAHNTDLNSARIAVEQSEASLKAAKLGYLPSLSFGPSISVSSFAGQSAFTYNLPLQLSWDIDAFGSITTQKRKSEVIVMEAKLYEESVRANLISTVAQQYNLLLVLDLQLEILTSTDSLWTISLETQQALWENGKSYATAVNQMESSTLNVKTQIIDVKRNIRSVENAICRLLCIPPQHIPRGKWGDYALPANLENGVSAEMLQNRPDVRLADCAIAEAYYNTQAARQAFFPSINLSGILGWTNSAGSTVVNPGKLLLNAALSLMQPIFMRGKLKAGLKIAKLSQEDMLQKYVQTVVNAGNQVNEAIADCQVAREKHEYYHRQVEILQDTYTGTNELMDNGKASYLEVLTAQESLLSTQLNEAMNMYNGAQAIIALYIALGGATK